MGNLLTGEVHRGAKRFGIPFSDYFWSRMDKSKECWPWIGKLNRENGYGQVRISGTIRPVVHRVAWELTYGPIPEGLLVCHHCDNPACCRPDHLFLGTMKDNIQDAVKKGRVGAQKYPDRYREYVKRATRRWVEIHTQATP